MNKHIFHERKHLGDKAVSLIKHDAAHSKVEVVTVGNSGIITEERILVNNNPV